jgi:hypothetical protein
MAWRIAGMSTHQILEANKNFTIAPAMAKKTMTDGYVAIGLRLQPHRRRGGAACRLDGGPDLLDCGERRARLFRRGGELQDVVQRGARQGFRVFGHGGRPRLPLGNLPFDELQRGQCRFEAPRKADRLRRIFERARDGILARINRVPDQVILSIVELHRVHSCPLPDVGREAADGLAERSKLQGQSLGLAAAARAQRGSNDTGRTCKTGSGQNTVSEELRGKPQLKAPAGGVAGQITRRLRHGRLPVTPFFRWYFCWYRPWYSHASRLCLGVELRETRALWALRTANWGAG